MKRTVSCFIVFLISIVIATGCSVGGTELKGSDLPQPISATRTLSDHGDNPELDNAMLAAEVANRRPPAGVDPNLWKLLSDSLADQLRGSGQTRITQAAPSGPANAIPNPIPADDGMGGFLLEWNYVNAGDYDINGEVNAADITPIALNFLATPASANWGTAQLADGDLNLEVNVADITPIAQYYLATVSGYTVFGVDGGGARTELGTVAMTAGVSGTNMDGRPIITFGFTIPSIDYVEYVVEPFHGSDPGPDPPDVTYITPEGGVTGTDVKFTVMLSEGEPDSYLWDFGGGATPNTSTAASPTVALGAIGDYPLSLTLSYPAGNLILGLTMTVVPEMLGTPVNIVDFFSIDTAQPTSGYSFAGLADGDGPRDLFLGNENKAALDVLYSDGPLTYDDFFIFDTVQGSLCGQLTYRIMVVVTYDAGNLNYHIESFFVNGQESFLVDDNDPLSGCDLPSTIRHELLHFEIAEMGARAFRYELLEILEAVETDGLTGQAALTEVASRMNTAFGPLNDTIANLQFQFDFEQYIDVNLNVVQRNSSMNKWDTDITAFNDATAQVALPVSAIDLTP